MATAAKAVQLVETLGGAINVETGWPLSFMAKTVIDAPVKESDACLN